MTSLEFDKLIDKEKYQVFVFTSLCSVPIHFARHAWFVVNQKGVISRWEIIYQKNLNSKSWGHLYQDLLLPTQGVGVIFFMERWNWPSTLLGSIEGEENSTAQKMSDLITHSKDIYPYCYTYSFFGPNSNSYIQWFLDKFPELTIKLPWNCFGKNFKKS